MDAKTIVRVDALFEATLGVVLVAGAAAGGLDGGDFPHPAGTALVVVTGVLLLLLAALLWPGAISLPLLAGGNIVTAAAAVTWLLAGSGFSTEGASLLVVTAVALLGLAAAQLAVSRR